MQSSYFLVSPDGIIDEILHECFATNSHSINQSHSRNLLLTHLSSAIAPHLLTKIFVDCSWTIESNKQSNNGVNKFVKIYNGGKYLNSSGNTWMKCSDGTKNRSKRSWHRSAFWQRSIQHSNTSFDGMIFITKQNRQDIHLSNQLSNLPSHGWIKLVSKFVAVRSNKADEAKSLRTVDNLIRSESGMVSWRINCVRLSSKTWPGTEFNWRRWWINERQWLGNRSKWVEIRIQSSSETPDGNFTTVRIPKSIHSILPLSINLEGGKNPTCWLKEICNYLENCFLMSDLTKISFY